MSIGQRLKQLRGNRSMGEVANAIGVTRSSYVKYERDERHPRHEVMFRIARYYGKTVDFIFFS